MIPHGVEVFVGLDPIDLRWSFERLSGLVAERVGRGVRSGALFVFFGCRRDALKLIFFKGSGLCQFYKRLDRGSFKVPEPPAQGVVAIDSALPWPLPSCAHRGAYSLSRKYGVRAADTSIYITASPSCADRPTVPRAHTP